MSIRVAQQIHDLDSGLERGLQKPLLLCDSLPLKKSKRKKTLGGCIQDLTLLWSFPDAAVRSAQKVSQRTEPGTGTRTGLTTGLQTKCLSSDCCLFAVTLDSSPQRGVMRLREGLQETAKPPNAQQASAETFPFRSKTDSSRDFSSEHRSLPSTDDRPPSPSHVLRSYMALFSPWAFSAHPPPPLP